MSTSLRLGGLQLTASEGPSSAGGRLLQLSIDSAASTAAFTPLPTLPASSTSAAEPLQTPPVPELLLRQLAGRLSSRRASLTGPARVERAWTAGYQARLVRQGQLLEGAVAPRLTGVNDAVFVVLRVDGVDRSWLLDSPEVFGEVVGACCCHPRWIAHSFPSLAELRAYCAGAGVPVPVRTSARTLPGPAGQ